MDKGTSINPSEAVTSPPPKLSTWQKFFYGTGCVFELTKWLIVLIVLGTLVHFYIGTISIVDGQSMEPNFHSGEYLIVNRWTYLFGTPSRGDPVVLRFPGDPEHVKYIKRIIGLPGEKVSIQSGSVYINDQKLPESYLAPGTQTYPNMTKQLGSEDYFLMGDNRLNSSDSRIWGVCPKRDLIGKPWYALWPLEVFGKVNHTAAN
ncbi:MAG: signal peptidase I [Patescibacteria group bacterium]|jgi:signal peptidase I